MRVAFVLVIAACGGSPSRPPDFNDRVLALARTYPEHGHGGYAWPAPPGSSGTTRDLRLGDTVIAHGGEGNHCVGITFEVYWRALESCEGGTARVFDTASAEAFRARWYVPELGGAGAAEALMQYGRGLPVALADARPGDFVQAWTADRSIGHSAIFLGWDRDDTGAIVAMRYWSSQPWTEGIGTSRMTLGEGGWDPAQIHIARAACP